MKRLALLIAFFASAVATLSVDAQIRTATTHPMKYLVSLPNHWTADRRWPVLVAPSAHYDAKGKSLAQFAAERDARKADFIIVAPFVINADPVSGMAEYRGAVGDAISAADAATDGGGRDEVARAKFDSEGVCAVIRDIQKIYHGEDKVWITGFSSSTHIAYMFLFAHPELLKGAVINSGVYLGRGVDENHIPLLNSPERAAIAIKFIVGEADPGYERYVQSWGDAKAKLLSYGHDAAKLHMELIRKGNPDQLGAGHQWFIKRILDFAQTPAGLGTNSQNNPAMHWSETNVADRRPGTIKAKAASGFR
jgi:predicted esterase